MEYEPGGPQAWRVLDLGSDSAYPSITGAIFEFGFSDAILQMWAAFLDELAHGREGMRQPFHCATPEEATATHGSSPPRSSPRPPPSVVPLSGVPRLGHRKTSRDECGALLRWVDVAASEQRGPVSNAEGGFDI